MWFSHPEALWLLLCCPFVVLFAALGRRRCAALLGQLGEPGLLQLTRSRTPKLQRPWVQALLLLLPIFSIIIALAEPRVSTGRPQVSANALDTVMVLDVSLSMAAEDVNGRSRLAAAREMVRSLLPELRDNRVGFITFAGTSFRQAELTQDLTFLTSLLLKEDIPLLMT